MSAVHGLSSRYGLRYVLKNKCQSAVVTKLLRVKKSLLSNIPKKKEGSIEPSLEILQYAENS